MNGRWRTWLLVGLGLAVVIAAVYFPILRRRVTTTAKIQQPTEEQARRELTSPNPSNTSDPVVKTRMFWASADQTGLAPISVELALSPEPVLRAKQVLNTLLAGPVDPELRTLPPDAALLAFYLLPDGTGIADFSEALGTSTPSGIESEQLAVDSIARTLEANVSQVKRLKILIHGQEMETLAGHLDLTQTFIVNSKAAQPGSYSLGAAAKPPRAASTAVNAPAGKAAERPRQR